MSWRFRKSFKVLPGLKLNLTSRGLSATLGAAPFSVNVGPRGVYSNTSIPGTGIWNRQRLDSPSSPVHPPSRHVEPGQDSTPQPLPVPRSLSTAGSVTEIRSASTEMLKSESMADLQRLLEETYEERTALEGEVAAATKEADSAASRYRSWESGMLFKRVFTTAFATRKEIFETAQAKLDELREQLRLTVLATQIDIDAKLAEPYYRMRDDFAKLCECQRAWDTLERRGINRVVERSAASEAITREPVSFKLGSCDLIQWEQKALHFPNRTGGDLYIYPGFALYRAAKKAFAIIDLREIQLLYARTRFIEDGTVPSDTQVVGQAWAKSNKDGSPDRRFRDNYQIPVVLYGSLKFTSPTGLQEEFQVSNAELGERFSKSWHEFESSLAPISPASQPGAWSLTDPQETENLDPATAFAKESEEARKLALERGDLWEFALTEELLRSKLEALESEYARFDQTLLSVPKKAFSGPDFVPWLGQKINEIAPVVDQMAKCFKEDVRGSWGKPGESGDPLQILRAVNTLMGYCRGFLNWEIEVCSAEPPVTMRPLRDTLRGMTGSIIGDVKRGTDELARAIADVRGGSKEFRARLDFSSSPQLARFNAEMDRINKNPDRFLE